MFELGFVGCVLAPVLSRCLVLVLSCLVLSQLYGRGTRPYCAADAPRWLECYLIPNSLAVELDWKKFKSSRLTI